MHVLFELIHVIRAYGLFACPSGRIMRAKGNGLIDLRSQAEGGEPPIGSAAVSATPAPKAAAATASTEIDDIFASRPRKREGSNDHISKGVVF